MKKSIIVLLATILIISLTACDSNTKAENGVSSESTDIESSAVSSTKESSTEVSSTEISTTEVSSNSIENLTETRVRELVNENTYCMLDVFVLDSLNIGEEVSGTIYKVDDPKYKSYSDFENYVRNVYCKKEADTLLNDYPYAGDPEYLNVDGDLCYDLSKNGGKGYYVDWSDFDVKIGEINDNECDITLIAKIEEPAENPVKEDYEVTTKVVYENGKWLLSELFY